MKTLSEALDRFYEIGVHTRNCEHKITVSNNWDKMTCMIYEGSSIYGTVKIVDEWSYPAKYIDTGKHQRKEGWYHSKEIFDLMYRLKKAGGLDTDKVWFQFYMGHVYGEDSIKEMNCISDLTIFAGPQYGLPSVSIEEEIEWVITRDKMRFYHG